MRGESEIGTIKTLVLVVVVIVVMTIIFQNTAFAAQKQLTLITPTMIKTQIGECFGEGQFLKGVESDSDGDGLPDTCDPCISGWNLGSTMKDRDYDGFVDECDVQPTVPDKSAYTACCGVPEPKGTLEDMQKACLGPDKQTMLLLYEPKFLCLHKAK